MYANLQPLLALVILTKTLLVSALHPLNVLVKVSLVQEYAREGCKLVHFPNMAKRVGELVSQVIRASALTMTLRHD